MTTDADGKITALETFPTSPQRLEPNHPSQTLVGNECKLETKHIRLKEDAKLVKNAYGFQLLGPTSQIGLSRPGRGAFFGTIDSPEKARELFEVGLGGSRIIKDKKQYQAIAKGADELKKHLQQQAQQQAEQKKKQQDAMTDAQLKRRDEIVFSVFGKLGIPLAWNLAGGYQKPITKVLKIHRETAKACLAELNRRKS